VKPGFSKSPQSLPYVDSYSNLLILLCKINKTALKQNAHLIQGIISFFQMKFSNSQHIISANNDPPHAWFDGSVL